MYLQRTTDQLHDNQTLFILVDVLWFLFLLVFIANIVLLVKCIKAKGRKISIYINFAISSLLNIAQCIINFIYIPNMTCYSGNPYNPDYVYPVASRRLIWEAEQRYPVQVAIHALILCYMVYVMIALLKQVRKLKAKEQ